MGFNDKIPVLSSCRLWPGKISRVGQGLVDSSITRRLEDRKTGIPEDRKTGRQENSKTGKQEHKKTGTDQNGL